MTSPEYGEHAVAVPAARVTAYPMAELPGSRPSKTREVIHAAAAGDVSVGWVTRPAGGPLCGAVTARMLTKPRPGLFAPLVTCRSCLAVADTAGIDLTVGSRPSPGPGGPGCPGDLAAARP
jgi:hypothetical protein